MVVDTYVKAAHGKAQRDWPFISCSNNKFTEVCPFPPSLFPPCAPSSSPNPLL